MRTINFSKAPKGYMPGLVRDIRNALGKRTPEGDPTLAHLYKGNFADPGFPMCRHGWNRENGTKYSIWRNRTGSIGICRICIMRVEKKLNPVPPRGSILCFSCRGNINKKKKCKRCGGAGNIDKKKATPEELKIGAKL